MLKLWQLAMVAVGLCAAAGIWAGREAAAPPVMAHVDPNGETKLYSYTDDGCMQAVDPVTVIFYYYGTAEYVMAHAAHHPTNDPWEHNDPQPVEGVQYFDEHGCAEMDGEAANNDALDDDGRFHMRIGENGGSDPFLGPYYSLATPHHEFNELECNLKHAVLGNYEDTDDTNGDGGFNEGRVEVIQRWTVEGNHYYGGIKGWGNSAMMRQCDGDYAWSDGFVAWIEISP